MAGLADGLCILDAVEGFAGEAAITKSLRSHCLLAVAYDYKYDAVLQNILNPYGYVFLLSLVLRLGPLGVMWLAVVCSSWVWVSRSSTKRSFVKPMGEESHVSVKQSNVMVSRATILIYICEALSLLWFLEQPSTSLMILHKRFQELLKFLSSKKKKVWSTRVWLGLFGAESPKPLNIYSNEPCVAHLNKHQTQVHLPPSGQDVMYTRNENGKMTGVPDMLKASQTYTPGFGRAVATVVMAYRRGVILNTDSIVPLSDDDIAFILECQLDDPWLDAELDSVFQVLDILVKHRASGV